MKHGFRPRRSANRDASRELYRRLRSLQTRVTHCIQLPNCLLVSQQAFDSFHKVAGEKVAMATEITAAMSGVPVQVSPMLPMTHHDTRGRRRAAQWARVRARRQAMPETREFDVKFRMFEPLRAMFSKPLMYTNVG